MNITNKLPKEFVDILKGSKGVYNSIQKDVKLAKAVMFKDDMSIIFDNYRISENQAEVKRRIELAEAVNKEDFSKAIRYIASYFDTTIVDISTDSQVLQSYISTEDIDGFFRDFVIPVMLSDPNAILAVIPYIEQGELKTTNIVVESEDIIFEGDTEIVFNYKGNQVYLSNTEVFTFNLKDEIFYEDTYINFNSNYRLFHHLGGVKSIGKPYLESYFAGAISKSVLTCRIASDKELLRMRIAHPLTIMKRITCQDCGGKGCSSCNNTGYKEAAPSMGTVYYINEADVTGQKEMEIDNIVKYIQPPLESVKIQREEYELHTQEVKQALSYIFLNQAQSGVAKTIDKEDKVASAEVILYRCYKLLEEVLNAVKGIIDPLNTEKLSIILPYELILENTEIGLQQGKLESEGRLIEENLSYYGKKYKDSPEMYHLYKWVILNDPLFPYTLEEKIKYGTAEEVSTSRKYVRKIYELIERYGTKVLDFKDKKLSGLFNE